MRTTHLPSGSYQMLVPVEEGDPKVKACTVRSYAPSGKPVHGGSMSQEKGMYSEVPYLEGEIKFSLRFELQFLIKYTVDLNIDCILPNIKCKYLHRVWAYRDKVNVYKIELLAIRIHNRACFCMIMKTRGSTSCFD